MTKREHEIRILLFFLGLGIFFRLLNFSHALAEFSQEEVKHSVVKITAYKPTNIIETGAGIILSKKEQKIFAVTAYRLIEEADSIYVNFYDNPVQKFQGKLYEKSDQENNIAVVSVEISKIPEEIYQLPVGDFGRINELDKVSIIGHPLNYDWQLTITEIQSVGPISFRLSGEGIDPRNNGGAILNEKGQLIGILAEKSKRDGFSLKINMAIEILETWNIPQDNLKYKDKGSWFKRNTKWLLAGGSTSLIVVYYILDKIFAKPSLDRLPDPPDPPP